MKPSVTSHGPHLVRSVLCDFGLSVYHLLTEFAFRTVRYKDQGPEVRTDLAKYEKKTRSINSSFYGQEMRKGQPS